jgi:hypothetical protein
MDQQYSRKLRLVPDSDKKACTANETLKGTFLLMSLADTWNPFEGMHQPLMAFASLARLGLNPGEVRLVHVGSGHGGAVYPSLAAHKMDDFAERVLSRGGPALHLDQESELCLENVILPIPGDKSFALNSKGRDDPMAARCSKSPVLAGFVDYVKDAFAVNQRFPSVDEKIRITLPLRKPSVEHRRPYKRQMSNADQVESALRSMSDFHAKTDAEVDADAMMERLMSTLMSSGKFDVHAVVPASMSIEEQVELFSNTDILIAPHGASLTWEILLPECGQVIEYCDGEDFHFVNFAHYAGKKHTCLRGPRGWGAMSFSADADATLQAVQRIEKEWRVCQAKKS